MIVYFTHTNGQATDLRFEKDDYKLEANEISLEGDVLPDIDTLHSKEYNQKAHERDMQTKRSEAYKAESDPIFFKYQRGEATKEEWLNKIKEIKERYA